MAVACPVTHAPRSCRSDTHSEREPRGGKSAASLGSSGEHRRIVHAFLVMGRTERYGLIEQHDCDQMLKANIRHVSVVDRMCRAGSRSYLDVLYVVCFKRVFLLYAFQCVQRRLDRTSHSPLLQSRLRHCVNFSQLMKLFGPARTSSTPLQPE